MRWKSKWTDISQWGSLPICFKRPSTVQGREAAGQIPISRRRRRSSSGAVPRLGSSIARCAAREADEEHTGAALRLRDLYVCRTCVNHIAQVYTKGIMTAWSDGSFGVDEPVTYREALEMRQRVVDRQLRRKPKPSVPAGWTTILRQEAESMLRADRRILLVDVRSEEEYARGHQKGSINIPLQALFRNPYCVCADRSAVLFLYCRKGYKSRIAAGLLAEAGYQKVYVVV